ncbi:MAG: hypothetical protein IRZ03_18865 [Acidobacterium ailaaui]|nr:hypothetical protein [Pseudacidobacterium ailaaui]
MSDLAEIVPFPLNERREPGEILRMLQASWRSVKANDDGTLTVVFADPFAWLAMMSYDVE